MILGWPDWANHTLGAALLVMFAWSMVWASRIDDDRYGGLRMFQKKESPKNDPDVARPIDVWEQIAGRCLPRYTFACFDCGVEYADTTDNRFDAFVYSVAGIEAGLDGWIVVKFCKACWKARLGNGGQRPDVDAASKDESPIPEPITFTPAKLRSSHRSFYVCEICERTWPRGTTSDWIVMVQSPNVDGGYVKHHTCAGCYSKLTNSVVLRDPDGVEKAVPAAAKDETLGRVVNQKSRAMNDVENERATQDAQWGGPDHDDQHNPSDWIAYMVKFGNRVYEPDRYRESMIKIAALAIAAVESFDRKASVAGESAAAQRLELSPKLDRYASENRERGDAIDRGSGHMTACRPGLCAERCPQPRPIMVPGHTIYCKPTRCYPSCLSPTTIVSASGESDDRRKYS